MEEDVGVGVDEAGKDDEVAEVDIWVFDVIWEWLVTSYEFGDEACGFGDYEGDVGNECFASGVKEDRGMDCICGSHV